MKKGYLFVLIIGFSLISCKDTKDTNDTKDDKTNSNTEIIEENITSDTENSNFDITKIPLSNFKITEIPFYSLPTGYEYSHKENRDYESIRFWVENSFVLPEGNLFFGRIIPSINKSFSALELTKNLDKVFTDAGAVKVFEGKVPLEAIKKNEDLHPITDYGLKANAYGFQGFSKTWSYVIRQNNQNFWIQLNESDDNASLHVAILKTKAIEITSQLIKADDMKLSLDENGMIALYINYDTNKTEIKPESRPILDEIFKLLTEHPKLKISIEGHTDNTGDKQYNIQLSELRAKSILDYLVNKGVSSTRLKSKGFGDTKPIKENNTEENKALNRRVELRKIE